MDFHYHQPISPPEIWGGIECTVNRIGDGYRDQLTYSGHYERDDDIDEIASLGFKKLRYPVLWESHQPDSPDQEIDWTRTEKKIQAIISHGIEPIIGLVHHGSGPSFTSLEDKDFGSKLADYAFKVATKFSFIKYYTPINEPLTTARFSGLYGLWYPHHKSAAQLCCILINELKGIVFSMQAIRKVNPQAVLIQTEDLSKVQSSRSLKYQAKFESERSWLTYDFLCGKVDQHHPFWSYFISMGIEEKDLYFFLDNPCPPGIAGFNYYVTSERYLDKNLSRWPEETHGGNGKHLYADVPAVRVVKPEGLYSLLKEAWNRYHIPMALTEVHINCTREEQLRWFNEAYDIACKLKAEKVPLVGVTAWSLLGAFDWDSLLTRKSNTYEAGAFDVSDNKRRPTALVPLIKSLAFQQKVTHPLLNQPGWWHYSYKNKLAEVASRFPPLLILGSNGTLGTAFRHICARRNIPFIGLARPDFNVTKKEHLLKAIEYHTPWAIINATGYVKVDDAEAERDICHSLNVSAVGQLAGICSNKGIQLMTFSSDLVFNGKKDVPYLEQDTVDPLNYYGKSKAEGEKLSMQNFADTLIVRTSSFFGPWDQYNFAHLFLKNSENGHSINVVKNVVVSPTYVPHLVDASLDLLIDRETGIWHLCNDGKISWIDFAGELAARAGYGRQNIIPKNQQDMDWKAARPAFSALESQKGIKLASLDKALQCFFEEK
jgi:dTDP-4-dehydrorhamnose reductase